MGTNEAHCLKTLLPRQVEEGSPTGRLPNKVSSEDFLRSCVTDWGNAG